jgi:nicotinate phosphoribosyltransferase
MLSFITGNYTDMYQLAMGEANFLQRRHQLPVCFDYFFRRVPDGGGYVLFAGLDDLLTTLESLRFTEEDISFLRKSGFTEEYLNFLKDFRFKGTLYSVKEGEVVFPGCPLMRVHGTQFEVQLVETLLLNIVNFESLIATKASRMRYVAGDRHLSDFGLRRSQGPGGVLASRAAAIGGFNSTSNVYAAQLYEIPPSGTMAHAFIQSFESELEAFRAFARERPINCVFLADTYNTLKSGIPNAITVAKEMEQEGRHALGVRLDSGDLAWLSGAARKMLDDAGLAYVKIVVSNQLDEHVIKSLLDQQAPIDVFGVGTRLVTGHPDGALDGVYKLSMIDGRPSLKMSDNIQKLTLPGVKQLVRILDNDGRFFGADAILLESEEQATQIFHPSEPGKSLDVTALPQEKLLSAAMRDGVRTEAPLPVNEIAAYAQQRLALLPGEYRRFHNPHVYKISLSAQLFQLRTEIVEANRERTKKSFPN